MVAWVILFVGLLKTPLRNEPVGIGFEGLAIEFRQWLAANLAELGVRTICSIIEPT